MKAITFLVCATLLGAALSMSCEEYYEQGHALPWISEEEALWDSCVVGNCYTDHGANVPLYSFSCLLIFFLAI